MNRRVLTWGALLAISAVLIIGIRGSYAGDGASTSRFKTVEVKTVQYVWELISGQNGNVICQVIVDHPNRPTNDETIQLCAEKIFPAAPTIAPPETPEPGAPTKEPPSRPTAYVFDLESFFRSVYWRFVTTRELTRTLKVPLPEIILHLNVPPDQTGPYFTTLIAYEPVFGQQITGIFGYLNGKPFTCPSARCDLPIERDSILEYWAVSSFGDESKHIQAVLQFVRRGDTTTLEVPSLNPINFYQDQCALEWGTSKINWPEWARFPDSPDELNTMRPLQYLAGKLLATGLAEAQECPGTGLTASYGANECGLEKSASSVIDWQNQFDVSIWEAGRSIGVPPRLVKTLIGQESQFWPGNSRNAYFEYGLGQLNQSGADVALRWDNDLFFSVCNGLVLDCSKIYGRLPYWMQATMRGGLVRSIDAECPTCPRGVDLGRANESIYVLARTLRANCRQTDYILRRWGAEPSYEDRWKYTLVSYHSGYQCLAQAISETYAHQLPLSWEYVSGYLSCPGSLLYIQDFWKSLEEFDAFRLVRADAARPVAQFSAVPTPAPTATPTPVLAMSHIRVLVYVDGNGNNYPEPDEKVDGVKVTLTSYAGLSLNAVSTNGEVVFDLSGRPVNESVTVTLPELFRSQQVRVTRDGEIPVVFRLEQPVVPPALP